jgi:hypothetical protein
MKARKTNLYRLRLLAIGATLYFLVTALSGIYRIWSTGSLDFYDFGTQLLSIGGVLAFLGFLVFFSSALWKHQIRRQLPPDDQILPVRDAGTDYLLTFAVSSILVAVTGLFLIRNVVSSGVRNPTPGNYPHIGSAKVTLDYLQEEAQLWQEDAYLVGITYELSETSPSRMLIEYQSFSSSSEVLSLWMGPDGDISEHIYHLDVRPGKWRAIQDSDWQIDSEEALRLFATKEGVSYCLMASGQHENRLQLERLALKEAQPVVWKLFLPDCGETQQRWYSLDAQTGEWLQRE